MRKHETEESSCPTQDRCFSQQLCCISHAFSRTASNHPNKIAIIHAGPPSDNLSQQRLVSHSPPVYSGDRSLTYSHLTNSINSLTSRLRSLLKPHQQPNIVGIYLPPSVEYIVSVLAVLKAGEAFMPIDRNWPKQRISSLVSSSNVSLIVTSKSLSEIAKRFDRPVLDVSFEELHADDRSFGDLEFCGCSEIKRPFCYFMYTSGSTGKPKGVCGTEQGLLNRFTWMHRTYPFENEVSLFKTAVSFVDHLQEFLSALLTGSVLVIPQWGEMKKNAFSLVWYLKAYGVTRFIVVPSLMRMILPELTIEDNLNQIRKSLRLLVLSGEALSLSLWKVLSEMLPLTCILNLYGSTEVSGDCMYFDCVRMKAILEIEPSLGSVPIGLPISNCEVVLGGENGVLDVEEGEIYVGGVCLFSGYYSESHSNLLNLPQNIVERSSVDACGSQLYYRSGDFARKLKSGDYVFLGRKDRIVKVNGQRIALEEIEDVLREHPFVKDAAAIFQKRQGDLMSIEAFIVLKCKERPGELLKPCLRSWMLDKLLLSSIPTHLTIIEYFPFSFSGKVDYELLAESSLSTEGHAKDKIGKTGCCDLLQLIKKTFSDAIMFEEFFNDDDDFFAMGGNSLTAAHVAYNLGIDMNSIYHFSTPLSLCMAIMEKQGSCCLHGTLNSCYETNSEKSPGIQFSINDSVTNDYSLLQRKRRVRTSSDAVNSEFVSSKCLKGDRGSPMDWPSWYSLKFLYCSLSRCNRLIFGQESVGMDAHEVTYTVKVPRGGRAHLKELWKVDMESCVDASPLVVFVNGECYLFIGSHSHKFLCIDARIGSIQWEVNLEGRIECSAVVIADFSQVVVGCYKGKIYFLDLLNGIICWSFETSGEVKSQPVVDSSRQLIWCGSYDHILYALDYKNYSCVCKVECGGSIYGSPAIDEANNVLYVASTVGRITALTLKFSAFQILWIKELKVPIFGSLSVSSIGTVICCLVDGHVLAINSSGSIVWKMSTAGPVFAGACISSALPSQVLICSRDGGVYSFKLDCGKLLWEYNVGDAITASAYVDEHLLLGSEASKYADRLISICSSSGNVYLLRINVGAAGDANHERVDVEEFSNLQLRGDVFSSPIMVGGRIFVGCRDDYLHCIDLEICN